METTIIEVLQQEGWKFDNVAGGIYDTAINSYNRKFTMRLNLINLKNSLIMATSYFPMVVEEHMRLKMAWELNGLNLKISIGSFQVNLKSGTVTYHAGFYFFNTPFHMDMLRNLLNVIVSYSNDHYPFLASLPIKQGDPSGSL
jgi:hypothetical protein